MKNVVWTSTILAVTLFLCFTSMDAFLHGPGVSSSSAFADDCDAPPPLVVDRDNPLTLKSGPDIDEEPEKPADPFGELFGPPKTPEADNKLCLVCHKNFEKEPLVRVHAKKRVGCANSKCHGESDEHSADEDNVTPPDKIYGRGAIANMCSQCHDEHDVAPSKVVERWTERTKEKPTVDGKAVCTDCHGFHRLKFRTVRWDKETRELIIRDCEKPEEGEEEDADAGEESMQ